MDVNTLVNGKRIQTNLMVEAYSFLQMAHYMRDTVQIIVAIIKGDIFGLMVLFTKDSGRTAGDMAKVFINL